MYVYETTNLINGKKYIGVSVTNKNSDKYLGSGVLLKMAINKYGVENFEKVILKNFDNEKEAREYEKYLIEELDAINSDSYYNLVVGGYGGGVNKHPVSEETKIKISQAKKGKKLNREQIVKMGKITLQYDLNGYFIKEFETKADAEKFIGCKMTKLVPNKVVYIKGFVWKYKNGEIEHKIDSYYDVKKKYNETASKLNAKLTKEEVFNLILDKENGMSYSEISKKYKISNSCAYEIVIGKTYKWVWDEK
jgi:hypothetical protein